MGSTSPGMLILERLGAQVAEGEVEPSAVVYLANESRTIFGDRKGQEDYWRER